MIDIIERAKYERIWDRGDYTSQSARPYAEYLIGKVGGCVLEIGSGRGVSLDILNNQRGLKCTGVDITLAGNKGMAAVFEAPAWALPFESNSFDYSFSTDVLEHLPREKVEKALKEIDRVTRHKTFHKIATFEMGDEHLTVEPITWWEDAFKHNVKIEYELTERKL